MGLGQKPVFEGVDSLVLYTLSSGGASEFADVKLCGKDKCNGYSNLVFEGALSGISSSSKVILATLLIYLSMAELDWATNEKNTPTEE